MMEIVDEDYEKLLTSKPPGHPSLPSEPKSEVEKMDVVKSEDISVKEETDNKAG